MRTMPGIDQLISGQVTINQLRSVNIEDLLGRDPVCLDTDSLKALLEGQVVLVTGAGGSIILLSLALHALFQAISIIQFG